MKKILFSLLFFLLSIQTVSAVTTYVATTGSDSNNCTQAQSESTPKLTIQAGLACVGYGVGAGANDIVEVRAGTYTFSTPIGGDNDQSFPSGTSWNAPFILRCRTGETCTIRGTGPYNLYLTNTGAMFSTIGAGTSPATGGFIFDGVNLGGDQVFMGNCCQSPTSVELLGNEFINTDKENAIYVGNFGTDVRIRYNYIHGGEFVTTANSQGRNHAIYFTSNNSLIEYNRIEDVKGYGYHGYYATDASSNIVRFNHIKNFSAPSSGNVACGILASRNSNQIYGNIVWSNDVTRDGQIGICFQGTGNIVWNNTVYGMPYIGISMTGASSHVTKNNIIRATTGNADFDGISGTYSNNICGAAATGCALSSDPLFVNAAGGNFSLATGSPAINAGVAAIASGVTACANDAAPDIGAIETLPNPTATVDGTALLITISNNCTTQVLPASSSVTGFTVKRAGSADTISSLSRSGSNSFVGVLADAFTAGQACLFTYAQSTGNAFSDNNIGNVTTSNQELFDMVDAGCTNITSGVGVGSVALSRWRFYLLQGATDTAWTAKCNENSADCVVSPGSKLWFRGKIRNNSGNNYPAFNYRTRARYNGGAYVTLTSSYVNSIKSLGTESQPGTVISQGAALTADLLTSDETTNVAGIAVKDSSSIPSVTLNDASEIEVAQAIDISTSAVVGDTYEFCPFDDAGTALTCATPAKITIGDYRFSY